jgi:phage-related protein
MDGQKINVMLLGEAIDFVLSLPEKARKKVTYNLLRVEMGEIDKDLFKKLGDTGIWEFRTLFNGICYRLFAFWDTEEGALVVATHGIVKKTQKTPAKEIGKAERVRKEWFENKKRINKLWHR